MLLFVYIATRFCDYSITNDTNRGLYNWPEARGGSQLEQPCVFGESGMAMRMCGETGGWEEPILSSCLTRVTAMFVEVDQVSLKL